MLTNQMKNERSPVDPYVLTHRRNYMLPVLTTNNINRLQYADIDYENLEEYEAKFQLGFKYRLIKSLLSKTTSFSLASLCSPGGKSTQTTYQSHSVKRTTCRSFSRDANRLASVWHHGKYWGERFIEWQPTASRSWNRFYAQFVVEKGRFVFSFKPWIRLQEDAKTDPLQ